MAVMYLVDDGKIHPSLNRHTVRDGQIEATPGTIKLVKHPTPGIGMGKHYGNAQLDDYQQKARRNFPWRPPLRLTVRARFSHPSGQLRGTAGFGFWNDPFMMTGMRWPTLPKAIWYFYSSPPSDMDLALGVPGSGWKAATIDTQRLPFYLLAPTAPVAILLMQWHTLYRRLWPIAQRAMHVCESLVPAAMNRWHTYQLEWLPNAARFIVDNQDVLLCDTAPAGPLGVVIWLDNQYLIVKPRGAIRHGLVASPVSEWLEIEHIHIEEL